MQSPVTFIILSGPNFSISFVNKRLLNLMGRSWERIEGRNFFEEFPELVRQGYQSIMKKVYSTGITYNAYEMPLDFTGTGTGSEFITFTLHPTINDNKEINGIAGIGVIVTDQVKSRIELQKSELKYHSILRSMNQGFCILDMVTDDDGQVIDYTYSEINKAFEEISGLVNVLGKSPRETIPDHADFWITNYGNVAITGKPMVITGEANKWYESYVFKIADDKKLRVGVLFTDISERVKEENTRKLYAEKLEKEVNDRTRELQRSNEDLMNFAHVASHDLKEPVRKIKTFISLLINEFGNILPERGRLFLDKIDSSASRMKSMIEGVLNYSSLEKSGFETVSIDMNELISSILTDLEVLIEAKNANFKVDRLPVIEGAKVLIYQLFYNLVNNAIKFAASDHSLIIEITTRLFSENNQEFSEFIISDNGVGFDPANGNRIFQTFSRLHPKDKYEGTGLGLALCKRITERHGGRIFANSKENEGASFHVILPVKQNVKK